MNETGRDILCVDVEEKKKYTAALRHLLSDRQFLARIMKRFMREFREYPLFQIEEECIEQETVTEGGDEDCGDFYDIRFNACYPRGQAYIAVYINFSLHELQRGGYAAERRGMYYAARRFCLQCERAKESAGHERPKKVYSVWICTGDVPDCEAGSASLYSTCKNDIIGAAGRNRDVYDMINVIILRLNEKVKSGDEVLELLQLLCCDPAGPDEKLERLREHGIRVEGETKELIKAVCGLCEATEKKSAERDGL